MRSLVFSRLRDPLTMSAGTWTTQTRFGSTPRAARTWAAAAELRRPPCFSLVDADHTPVAPELRRLPLFLRRATTFPPSGLH